jgi:DNA processing protein
MDTLAAIVALSSAPGMNAETLCALLDRLGADVTGEKLLERARVATKKVWPDWQQRLTAAADALDTGRQQGVVAIPRGSTQYPSLLRAVSDAPPVLFVRGNLEALSMGAVAVVGSREASAFGLGEAARIAQRLVEAGIAVVSGLALGIDTEAHRGCVAAKGRGIAVLAHGHQLISPSASRGLAKQLLDGGGALVSEYVWGTPGHKGRFVERDRVQAALSGGVIVVETKVDGGTMHTARAARRYRRPLGVVIPKEGKGAAPAGNQALLTSGAISIASREDLEAFMALALRSNP